MNSSADVLPPDAQLRAPRRALLADRPERCVWGTNWPHPGLHAAMPNDADLVELLESWIAHDALRQPLYAGNAAKLYRLGES